MKPTHLDLFSGIGGFTIAAKAAGFETIGFSEIEPYACKILKRHWPNVPNYGDIRNVRGLRSDLITGGFPCQPFSFAGKRRGSGDDRALWSQMFRVIDETRPSLVLAENVPGIISMELDRVLSDLESIGYTTRPLVIPACAVDAVNESGLWPTPNASDNRPRATPASTARRLENEKQISLEAVVKFNSPVGQLNPNWVEWLMGFPIGHTVLNPSETPSSPKSQKSCSGK